MTVSAKNKFEQIISGVDFEFLKNIHQNHPNMPCRQRWVLYLREHPRMTDVVKDPNSRFKFVMIADDDPVYIETSDSELRKRKTHLLLMWNSPDGSHVFIDATPGMEASKHTNFRALKSDEEERAFYDVFSDISGLEAISIRRSVELGLQEISPAVPILISSHEELSRKMN